MEPAGLGMAVAGGCGRQQMGEWRVAYIHAAVFVCGGCVRLVEVGVPWLSDTVPVAAACAASRVPLRQRHGGCFCGSGVSNPLEPYTVISHTKGRSRPPKRGAHHVLRSSRTSHLHIHPAVYCTCGEKIPWPERAGMCDNCDAPMCNGCVVKLACETCDTACCDECFHHLRPLRGASMPTCKNGESRLNVPNAGPRCAAGARSNATHAAHPCVPNAAATGAKHTRRQPSRETA